MKAWANLFGSFSEARGRLFIQREYDAIQGKGRRVFGMLLIMALATLLAVVVARAGLTHLHIQMDDPFTSMLSIDVSGARYGENYGLIHSFLQDCSGQGKYNANRTSGNYVEGWNFYTGRRIDEYTRVMSFGYWKDHELLERILEPENVTPGYDGSAMSAGPDAFKDGVIISKEFFDELECDMQKLQSSRIVMGNGGYIVPLRVLAVVYSLPGRTQCLVEHSLLMNLREDLQSVFPEKSEDQLEVWVEGLPQEQAELSKLENGLEQFFEERVQIRVEPVEDMATHTQLLSIERSNRGKWKTGDMVRWQKKIAAPDSPLRSFNPAVKFNMMRLPAPDSSRVFGTDEEDYRQFDQLTITFKDMDEIGEFQQAISKLKKREDDKAVELDLDRVESKKNFNTVAGLSYFLLASLVLFSILSIILYLYNLLRGHLERMKMNLGTFMAFGFSPELIKAGYLRIILMLLLRVLAVAMVILLAIQLILWALASFGAPVPAIMDHVSVLLNPWLYACMMAIVAASMLICRWQLARFLSASPGDLIYDRK